MDSKPIVLDVDNLKKTLTEIPQNPIAMARLVSDRTIQLISNSAVKSAVPYKTGGSWKMLVATHHHGETIDRDAKFLMILRGLLLFHIQQLYPAGVTNCYADDIKAVWLDYAGRSMNDYSVEDRVFILSFIDKPALPIPPCPTCHRPFDE